MSAGNADRGTYYGLSNAPRPDQLVSWHVEGTRAEQSGGKMRENGTLAHTWLPPGSSVYRVIQERLETYRPIKLCSRARYLDAPRFGRRYHFLRHLVVASAAIQYTLYQFIRMC